MISCPDFLCCLLLGGQFFIHTHKSCIVFETSTSYNLFSVSARSCVKLPRPAFLFRLPFCPCCPFLEFMVAVMASASVFYEAAGGVGCQGFLAPCLTAPFL